MVVDSVVNKEGKKHLSVAIKVIKVQTITINESTKAANKLVGNQPKQSLTNTIQVQVEQEQSERFESHRNSPPY